jgi:hypothetical protein
MITKLARFLTVTTLVTAGVSAASAPAQASSVTYRDPAVITEWNTIAARTIYTENLTPIPSSGLYFGFVSIAVHDAVVAIEGGSTPYAHQPRPQRGASSQIAAATASYRVLTTYFPASAAALTADYNASLSKVPDGSAKTRGQQVGEAAAATVIRLRQNDGRGATVPPLPAPSVGVWRPTPPASAAMTTPWLGFVKPLTLRSPTQIHLSGPDALNTAAYARDFAEVKTFGALTGSVRTPWQTETALFWNANAVLQYQVALRDQVTRRGLDIAASARAFALLGSATADSLISCWRAKYDNAYWRPITAIHEARTDGNPRTSPDPDWAPMLPTPPYPEYTSGHACITGVATEIFSHLFGANSLNLDILSSVTSTIRHYDRADMLDAETMNARIWLGFHFRTAMTDGNRLAHRVAGWAISRYFQPDC